MYADHFQQNLVPTAVNLYKTVIKPVLGHLTQHQHSAWDISPLNVWRETALVKYQPLRHKGYYTSPSAPIGHHQWTMPYRYSTRSRYHDQRGLARRERRTRTSAYSRRFYGRRTGRTRRIGFFRGAPRAQNKELKFLDTILNTSPVTPALIIRRPAILVQGVEQTERIGRVAYLRQLHWKGSVILEPTTTAAAMSEVYSLFVIHDMQTNGVKFLETDLFTVSGIEPLIWSFNNLDNQQRFKILWKRTFTLNAGAVTGTSSGEVAAAFDCNLKMNIKMEFSGATGGTTEIKSSNIYCCYFQQSGSTNSSLVSRSRLRFTD